MNTPNDDGDGDDDDDDDTATRFARDISRFIASAKALLTPVLWHLAGATLISKPEAKRSLKRATARRHHALGLCWC